jgi:hypothetical protein
VLTLSLCFVIAQTLGASAAAADAARVVRLSDGWRIRKDPDNKGKPEEWFKSVPQDTRSAVVPGTMQQTFPGYHGVAWYWTEFDAASAEKHHHWFLHFGAVDYYAEVWLNGRRLGEHEGTDGPFELDATAALRPSGKNLLAVRVINPGRQPKDGFVVREIPHSFKQGDGYEFGYNANSGGILLPVELRLQPIVRVVDIFVRPNMTSGEVRVQVTAENLSAAPAECLLKADVRSRDSGYEVSQSAAELRFIAPPGKTEQNLSLRVRQPRLWSTREPNLYTAGVALDAALSGGSRVVHQTAVRFGFREFRVAADGYFRLNGRRLFLKACHTVNNFPVAIGVAHRPELLTRDLLYAKGMGFDMVRFLGGPPLPEQLQFCDEIGLMIYAESRAAWCLADSPRMAERYDRSVSQMILRDRNHPCVVMWGLLNETGDGPVFRHAAAALPLVRSLDDTRLVLLNSGRHFDNQLSIGSLCNPGNTAWEYLWGDESPGAKGVRPRFGAPPTPGDLHFYPSVPHNADDVRWLRTAGGATKPLFLSEYGIGSLVNPYRIMRLHEQDRTPEDALDFTACRRISERLTADLKRYGMDGLFPFPEDLIVASERMHARHRTLGYNAIRSNPRLCGYSLTGIIDQPAGEGLMTEWRELKQGIMDAMTDCLAPLRWCLFVEPMHVYAGRPFRIEAVMANDGVLASGEYPARLKIVGPGGVVWQKTSTLVIPPAESSDKVPLVTPLLTERVTIHGPAGVYTFAAEVEHGGAARGGRLEFYLSRAEDLPRLSESVAVLGVSDEARKWLRDHGAACLEWNDPAARACRVIVVGDGPTPRQAAATWRELARRMATGDVAVFLKPSAFAEGRNSTRWLPLKTKGVCRRSNNWVYHREDVAKQHPVFEGLPAGGMLNWYYYLQTTPNTLFAGLDTPADAVAAAFGPGDAFGPSGSADNGYTSGLLLGGYRMGSGRFFLNTFRILENLNANPAADRLLLNLIRTAAELGKDPRTELPPDFETRLKEIGYSQ